MKKYKAYLFDFDLTLADSSAAILICFKHTLKAFGYQLPDDRTIYNTIGLTIVDSFDILTGIKNNPQREQMREEFVRKADEVMAKQTYFYDGSADVLQSLRQSGAKVGIVSTKYRYRIDQTFELQLQCHPYDLIVGGEDVTEAKPDPQGINLSLESFGLEKSDALYIGDSYVDAKTALNAGVDFAAVLTGSTTKEEFESYPNICVGKSLTDIFSRI